MRRRRGKKARAILEILEQAKKRGRGPLTARQIHEELKDGTEPPSTYAALARLVNDGEVSEAGDAEVESGHVAKQYELQEGIALQQSLFSFDAAPALLQIFGQEPLSPDDALRDDEELDGNEPNVLQRVSAYAARLATYENRRDALRRAARKLAEINPRILIRDFLWHLIVTFKECASQLQEKGGVAPGKVKDLHGRLLEIKEVFDDAARTIGLPKHIVELEASREKGSQFEVVSNLSEEEMYQQLEAHVETVIYGERVLNQVDDEGVRQMKGEILTVTSSDGSMHPLALSGIRRLQSEYEPDGPLSALMFNNAAGVYKYSREPEGTFSHRFLPLSRQRIEKGIPEGIILAPFMYPELDDSQYAHMLRFVPDNIQFMLDLEILTSIEEDHSRDEGSRPVPNVHIRDGMGVPYERGFNHFIEDSAYGKHARIGIRRYYEMLRAIVGARGISNLLVVTGAVKEARLRFFAYIIDWFISKGSELICPDGDGEPIDVEWPDVSVATLTDNKAMANLMAAAREEFPDQRFTSFRVRREFSTIAEAHRPQQKDGQGNMRPVTDWRSFFDRKLKRKIDNELEDGNSSYKVFASKLDITPFVTLCEQADITLFYTSDTGGSPAYGMPRYEFVNNLKTMTQEKREAEIERSVNAILAGIEVSGGLDIDAEHNFMRDAANRLLIVEPAIMLEAHRAAKLSGKALAEEIVTAIYSNMARNLHMDQRSRLEIRPISFEQYAEIDHKFYKGLVQFAKRNELDPMVRRKLKNLGIGVHQP